MIVGSYINKNYNYPPFLPEIPYEEDNLILYDNNKFSNSIWGVGTYKITYSIFGTKILFTYEFGISTYKTDIKIDYFGNPKIILFEMENHHYGKR